MCVEPPVSPADVAAGDQPPDSRSCHHGALALLLETFLVPLGFVFFCSSLRRGDLNCNYPSDHQQPEHSGMDVGPCSRQESDVRRLHKVVDKDRVETGSRVATLAVAFSHLKAESEQDQCRPDGPTAQLT